MQDSLPCAKGKRSAVAVVNDSPVDCQSRDGGIDLMAIIPQSPLCGDSPLYTRGPFCGAYMVGQNVKWEFYGRILAFLHGMIFPGG